MDSMKELFGISPTAVPGFTPCGGKRRDDPPTDPTCGATCTSGTVTIDGKPAPDHPADAGKMIPLKTVAWGVDDDGKIIGATACWGIENYTVPLVRRDAAEREIADWRARAMACEKVLAEVRATSTLRARRVSEVESELRELKGGGHSIGSWTAAPIYTDARLVENAGRMLAAIRHFLEVDDRPDAGFLARVSARKGLREAMEAAEGKS